MDLETREALRREVDEVAEEMRRGEERKPKAERAPARRGRAASVRQEVPIPKPPDLKLHVIQDYDLDEIFRYINPQMLYVRHLGYRGRFKEAIERHEAKAVELREAVKRVEEEMLRREDIRADAVFKFFPVQAEDQRLLVYASNGKEVLETFALGRQREGEGLSLVDYVATAESGRLDYLAMFVTTVGSGVRALAEEWKERGDYLASHILQSLALEGAESFAEVLHQQLRKAWGFPDPPGITMEEIFKARYEGKRFSFGYPACPRLEDQAQLFRLLEVEQHLDAELTEGFMMDPESSVSALVFHHPDAMYFNLSEGDIEALEREVEVGSAQGR